MSGEDERAGQIPALEGGSDEPLLKIVKGDPSPQEVAALVAVVGALGSAATAPAPSPRPEWNAPHRLVRTQNAAGPSGWRSSGLPR